MQVMCQINDLKYYRKLPNQERGYKKFSTCDMLIKVLFVGRRKLKNLIRNKLPQMFIEFLHIYAPSDGKIRLINMQLKI